MALTLSDECRDALFAFAEAIEKPAATLAAELLNEMTPQIEGLAKIARAAKSGNKAAAKRALVHMVGDQFAELMSAQQPGLFKGKLPKGAKS